MQLLRVASRAMFSGIIESVQTIEKVTPLESSVRIEIGRPAHFTDLQCGDSIAVNGVCLTLESFDSKYLRFVLGLETLHILGLDVMTAMVLVGKRVNLERSLKWGDRVHGHLVTGHVDTVAKVARVERVGESLLVDVQFPPSLSRNFWSKGSVTLNGVSLTINKIEGSKFGVCLIPETIQRTNLGTIREMDDINVEVDTMGRALTRALELGVSREG